MSHPAKRFDTTKTHSGLRRSKLSALRDFLFDHLIGAQQNRWGYDKAERLSRCEKKGPDPAGGWGDEWGRDQTSKKEVMIKRGRSAFVPPSKGGSRVPLIIA
jgi:hypothetical protein